MTLGISAFQKYAELRQQFTNMAPAKMDGMVGTSEFTEGEFMRIDPLLAQLNHLIFQIRERAQKDYEYSVDAMKTVTLVIKEKAGLDLDMEFPD
ncbi:MAG: hypothetical protein QM492_08085 [Rhodobacterales bacterium]